MQCHIVLNGPLEMWVVYNSPKDFPGRFIARKWIDSEATEVYVEGETLDAVRACLPMGLARIERDAEDDSCIVETWF